MVLDRGECQMRKGLASGGEQGDREGLLVALVPFL